MTPLGPRVHEPEAGHREEPEPPPTRSRSTTAAPSRTARSSTAPYKRGQPVEFPLNGVIPCWTEGVQKMKVGGEGQARLPVGDRLRRPRRPPEHPARRHPRLRGRASRHREEVAPARCKISGRAGPPAPRGFGGIPVKIHEYQGKAVLASFGVPVPKGKVAYTADEAVEIGKELGFPVVVKAQIHAGGRGKGGGVKLARTADECETIAKAHARDDAEDAPDRPRGPRGAAPADRAGAWTSEGSRRCTSPSSWTAPRGKPVFMASSQGGMDIEEVAAKDPKAILKEIVEPAVGFQAFQARKLAFGLGLAARLRARRPCPSCRRSTRPSRRPTASLLEINPFLMTRAGDAPGPRREDQLRRQRPLSPSRAQGAARLRRGGPPRGRGLASSPQLHQARGRQRRLHGERRRAWPWPPWTSSSSRAARPRTSSTWAAGPTRSRSRTPSASSWPTRT